MKYAFIIVIFWFLIHTMYTLIDGIRNKVIVADVAVVLGNKVNENGTLSKRLENRVICGRELYTSGKVKKILVSGGLGAEGYYEADKMKEYLINSGVPDSAILVDNLGMNTRETAINAVMIMKQMDYTSVMVVSQFYHITRCKKYFRKYSNFKIGNASPSYYEKRDVYSLVREFFAFYFG